MRASRLVLLQPLHLALICGAAAGFIEAILVGLDGSPWPTSLATFGAVSLMALLLGVVQTPLLSMTRWFTRVSGLEAWLASRLCRDAGVQRDPVVRFHAQVSTLAVLVPLALLFFQFGALRLERIQDRSFYRFMLSGFVLGLVVGGAAASALLTRLIYPLVLKLDRRLGLPWPAASWQRYLIYVLLPLGSAIGLALVKFGPVLKLVGLQPFMGLILFWLLQGWLARTRLGVLSQLPRWVLPISLSSSLVSGVVTHWLVHSMPETVATLNSRAVARESLKWIRRLTDVDRDGFSSLYGGGDCAAFDSRIHPLARDIPDNEVDENCDGELGQSDGSKAGAIKLRRLLGTFEGTGLVARRYNILWIVIDAMRADRVSVLGYSKSTTPYLERLAKHSFVFSNATTQGSSTTISIGSMLTGIDPREIRWKTAQAGHRLIIEEAHFSFPRFLGKQGYTTAIITNSYMKAQMPALLRGFQRVYDTWPTGTPEWDHQNASIAGAMAISHLESQKNSKQPFFLLMYTTNPHLPYEAHPEAYPEFGEGDHARYLSEIAFADRKLGFLLDYLRYQPRLWQNTVVIVTADHGEGFGEHGASAHGNNCHREQVHVPLILRTPGVEVGKRIDAPVAIVDIVPTLLDLTGLDPKSTELSGQSLLIPALAPSLGSASRPIFCSALPLPVGKLFGESVRVGGYALVRDATTRQDKLYHTQLDPTELHDLASDTDQRQRLDAMRKLLQGSLRGNLANLGRDP